MAALRYKDEYNKVGYLLKPTESDDYHQIIDFWRASHIRYALTHDPIIFDSLVKQFWSTATLRAPKLGPPAILATIDKTPYTITEDLIPSNNFRQPTSDPIAPVLEHGQSADPNTASFSRSHETDAGPFTPVDDTPMRGNFHTSPPSSTLVQKVHSLESELKDHKKLFKDVVGKLVKKVKALEVKLKTKKRKLAVSDSDQEDGGTQDMDLDALRALANVVVTVDSNIPSDGTSHIPAVSPSGTTTVPPGPSDVPPGPSDVPLGTSAIPTAASTVPADSLNVLTDVSSSAAPPGEEAAKRLHDEEMAHMERKRAKVQRKRQQDVLDSAMYYNKSDWLNIRAQFKANASLSKTLLGDDVSEDNFPARMAALITRKRQALAKQLFKERQQSTEALSSFVPEVSHLPAVSSPPSSRTRRKSLGRKHMQKPKYTLPKLDLDAPAQTFIKVVVNEDSDDEDLVKLYGLVVQYYENYPVAGSGLLFWGDLQVLFDSQARGKDVSYPLSIKLMERMLMHKLEIDSDVVGNDMTTAEQFIQFIKNQLAAAQASFV
nr:xylulose kinase-1 [Tanacetum cinerariifolium]